MVLLEAWDQHVTIQTTQGDLLKANAEALVNTVNCVGFMGRGIAAQFKRAWPDNFRAYEAACKQGAVQPGQMFITETGRLVGPRWLVNFPTKRHWRGQSRMEDIERGLTALVADVARLGIRSIAIPPLGCGLGGLRWDEVKPRIEFAFAALPEVQVLLYEPAAPPAAADMARQARPPEMTPGRAVLVGLMDRYLAGLLDPWVSLLEVHKLLYFAQVAGENLRLRYVKAPYGPYAENLRHVLSRVEGHLLSGYADGGDQPDKPLALQPGAVEAAMALLATAPESRARFAEVASLVEGFESSFGMELLATVHWVWAHEGATGPEEATQRVYAWNSRKRQFTARQIQIAWTRLSDLGWLREERRAGALR